jgi:hypothetical protein
MKTVVEIAGKVRYGSTFFELPHRMGNLQEIRYTGPCEQADFYVDDTFFSHTTLQGGKFTFFWVQENNEFVPYAFDSLRTPFQRLTVVFPEIHEDATLRITWDFEESTTMGETFSVKLVKPPITLLYKDGFVGQTNN